MAKMNEEKMEEQDLKVTQEEAVDEPQKKNEPPEPEAEGLDTKDTQDAQDDAMNLSEDSGEDSQDDASAASEESEDEDIVKKLEEENAYLKDQLLRKAAEFDNYRKRTLREKLESYNDAVADSVKEFLPVMDNFERALEAPCSDENFKKGIEMIMENLKASFEKLGVKEIKAQGEPFDPNLHNAVNQVSDENLPENTVRDVFQKGYILGDKVIRHAMVSVANP